MCLCGVCVGVCNSVCVCVYDSVYACVKAQQEVGRIPVQHDISNVYYCQPIHKIVDYHSEVGKFGAKFQTVIATLIKK